MTTKTDLPGAGSITWRINGEMILILGWTRAILMQIAHPMVAEGVSHHSHFYNSPADKARRLNQTLTSMLQMTFGTQDEAWGTARKIDGIHGYVNGNLEESVGVYHQGAYYTARDPELLKWVHATFVDSMLKTYELYVKKLSQAEKDQYLSETSVAGPMLGAPQDFFPTNTAELESYLNQMLNSGKIAVGKQAHWLADYVLAPLPVPLLGRWLRWFLTLPLVGLLPDQLRQTYGLRYGGREKFALAIWAGFHRKIVRPVLPKALYLWPMAREAEKRLKASQSGIKAHAE